MKYLLRPSIGFGRTSRVTLRTSADVIESAAPRSLKFISFSFLLFLLRILSCMIAMYLRERVELRRCSARLEWLDKPGGNGQQDALD